MGSSPISSFDRPCRNPQSTAQTASRPTAQDKALFISYKTSPGIPILGFLGLVDPQDMSGRAVSDRALTV
jgi:hypothetical protein